MFHVNLSAKSFAQKLLFAGVLLCSCQVFAQKGGNRVDALIQRNRKLTADINALSQLLSKQSNQIISQEGINNYYKSVLKTSRDSTEIIQKIYTDYNQ